MACLSPIPVPDKVLSTFGYKGSSLLVPCGHCAGCQKDRRNDWFVRLWSVYNECRSKHLPVWFFTATIDSRLWPGMTIDCPGVADRVAPFVRSWTERFRYLHRGKMPLRFMCSEYGSKDREYVDKHGVIRVTTGALHFHGLIFGKIDVSKLNHGFRQTHGYVDFDLIRGPQAIRYTVKYCTKDYSIKDPSLRARTFCSPGIGDPKFYFGDSLPTHQVLINGFHYRTPRYFIDRQLKSFYKDRFFNQFGRSIVVVQNAMKRVRQAQDLYSEANRYASKGPKSYEWFLSGVKKRSFDPYDLDRLNTLFSCHRVGSGHSVLRHGSVVESDERFYSALLDDSSFEENSSDILFVNQFNLFNHERDQVIFPLSCNFAT